jgi:hypothetical protein
MLVAEVDDDAAAGLFTKFAPAGFFMTLQV